MLFFFEWGDTYHIDVLVVFGACSYFTVHQYKPSYPKLQQYDFETLRLLFFSRTCTSTVTSLLPQAQLYKNYNYLHRANIYKYVKWTNEQTIMQWYNSEQVQSDIVTAALII